MKLLSKKPEITNYIHTCWSGNKNTSFIFNKSYIFIYHSLLPKKIFKCLDMRAGYSGSSGDMKIKLANWFMSTMSRTYGHRMLRLSDRQGGLGPGEGKSGDDGSVE